MAETKHADMMLVKLMRNRWKHADFDTTQRPELANKAILAKI